MLAWTRVSIHNRPKLFLTGDIMSTDTTTSTTETTTTESQQEGETTVVPQKLTAEQEINALRSVHEFLSQFDRVPGFLANKWSQALDAVAVVANSLIAKATEANGTSTTEATSTPSADSADTTVAQ
jgi:hypothetical protein